MAIWWKSRYQTSRRQADEVKGQALAGPTKKAALGMARTEIVAPRAFYEAVVILPFN
jgi:hypothetical protein